MHLPSIRALKTGSLLLAALAASALPVLAGDPPAASGKDKNPVIEKSKGAPRFYVDLLAGGEFDTGVTDFIGNGQARNIAQSVGGLLPFTIPAFIQARNFNETHDAAVINGRLELGYKVLPYLSVFTSFTYSHAGGNDHANVGTAIIPTVPSSRVDLFAGVGQYQAFAGRAGFKVTTPRTILDLLHLPKAIKPYASFSAGGKYIDSQSIRFFTEGGLPVDNERFKLYDDSWVFSVEGNLGYDLQLTRNFSVILENGYGYDSKPDSGGGGTSDGLQRRGITGVSTKGSRVYSTVSLGAKLAF